jgi:hypothetical protein
MDEAEVRPVEPFISAKAHEITERLSHSPERRAVVEDSDSANLRKFTGSLRSEAVKGSARMTHVALVLEQIFSLEDAIWIQRCCWG